MFFKTCKICFKEKPISKFQPIGEKYTTNTCQSCLAIRRKRNPKRRVFLKEYRKNNSEYFNKKHKIWRENNKEQYLANQKFGKFRRTHNIEPQPCAVCNSFNSEAHHPDYSFPLSIIWLCKLHHKKPFIHFPEIIEKCYHYDILYGSNN